MKDLTKAIDTLDSINKIMGCMKEHLQDGLLVRTIYTDYTISEYGVKVICEVENKYNSVWESNTTLYFDFGTDCLLIKDMIVSAYNRMCEEIRINIEEEKRVNIDESMR